MNMVMYPAPPFPILMNGVGNAGEICSPGGPPTAPVSIPYPDVEGAQMSGLGDPFGISDIATAISSYFTSKAQAKSQKDALEAQMKMAQMAASQNAVTTAQNQAQSQVDTAAATRNSTLYSLYAIGGVATIVGVAFLLSAMKGKK